MLSSISNANSISEIVALNFLDKTIKEECLTRTVHCNLKKSKKSYEVKASMILNLISLPRMYIIEEANGSKRD